MASYLVTGGCGFIGSHLCDALVAHGDTVRVLDDLSTGKREQVPAAAELIVGDVGDRRVVGACMDGMDGCFHLAAVASVERSINDWTGSHRTNLTGAVNVFDAARSCQGRPAARVVYASSAAVYGDTASARLSETDLTRPLTPYGADKLGCEIQGRVAWLIHQVPNTGLRFFNVYGPRQDPSSPYSGVISIFADRLVHGNPVVIHGDGEQVRDFVYVKDVVRFLIAVMARDNTGAEIYNVCTGKSTSVRELAKVISVITGGGLKIRAMPARLGDIRVSVGEPGKAWKGLLLRAETDLGAGLRDTIMNVAPVKRSAA